MTINPARDLPALLMSVDNPGRYVGGEFAAVTEHDASDFSIALCFPDLYEIGMSNNAIRILYSLFNSIPGVRCERVFAPAPDFEQTLIDHQIPLYSLESGTPLHDFDVIAFSVGYELSATSILTVLDRGGISLRRTDRGAGDPVIIAGGPAVTNPLPLAKFVDAFFIGEAEGHLPALIETAARDRAAGCSRDDVIAVLAAHPSIFAPASPKPLVRRSIWGDFGARSLLCTSPVVPSIRVVQDHGVVEIMRGCPNGCRFCHAGIYYRPYRMKGPAMIEKEVNTLVREAGYRHVTLSSLSSADYADVGGLIRELNRTFREGRVSFALPSLRVNAMNLRLLEEISSVRKSGLTFAVETPLEADQIGLNKQVNRETLISVLQEAKRRGWRVAKFYFMIGLPGVGWSDQADRIIEYMGEVKSRVKININVNAATFVPKPHTPFQWSPQLSEASALEDLSYLKRELRRLGIKFSYASPFHSLLEGIVSRGDERVGDVIEAAYREGTRLDAWDEYTSRDAWNLVLDRAPWPVRAEAIEARPLESPLPWDFVSLGASKRHLVGEYRRASEPGLTEYCAPECAHHCGVCNAEHRVRDLGADAPVSDTATEIPPGDRNSAAFQESSPPPQSASDDADPSGQQPQVEHRIVFSFSRNDAARFVPHLATMTVFERSLQRAGMPVSYTEGFNPKPRLEFAQPLSLGIASRAEIAAVDLRECIDPETFSTRVTEALPPGFQVGAASATHWQQGSRKPDSLMSLYWGSRYRIELHPGPSAAKPDMSALAADLCRAAGITNFQESLTGQGGCAVEFDLESDAGRIPGVKTLLTDLVGGNPVEHGLSVVRVDMYAKDKAGRPVSYFSLPQFE